MEQIKDKPKSKFSAEFKSLLKRMNSELLLRRHREDNYGLNTQPLKSDLKSPKDNEHDKLIHQSLYYRNYRKKNKSTDLEERYPRIIGTNIRMDTDVLPLDRQNKSNDNLRKSIDDEERVN